MVAFKVMGENREIFGDEKFSRKVRYCGRPSEDEIEALKAEMKYHFRCCDDDGTTYFWGLCSDDSSEEAFAPLDCLGEAYGCTYIEYKNDNGEWEEL